MTMPLPPSLAKLTAIRDQLLAALAQPELQQQQQQQQKQSPQNKTTHGLIPPSLPPAELKNCATLLSTAKVLLTQHSFLVPHAALALASSSQQNPTDSSSPLYAVILARDILELGVLHSVHSRDIAAFERYWMQLSVYYASPTVDAITTPSTRRMLLHALHLLSLLAQNRIAEFHAQLELLSPVDKQGDPYVSYVVQLEQAIMEGSYARVWRHTRANVPSPLFLHFIDTLLDTVRCEIAAAAATCYTKLSLQAAATLFFFARPGPEFDAFIRAQSPPWRIVNNNTVVFTDIDDNLDSEEAGAAAAVQQQQSPDVSTMMQHALAYARDLERIV